MIFMLSKLPGNDDVGLFPEIFHHRMVNNMLWQSHTQDVPVVG